MPEAPMATLGYKDRLKLELFPTIWCPGCGIGTIMIMLAQVLDEMGWDETNTIVVTGIGCTGRMGGYMKYEGVYTLHGRTLPVAEAIKTVRPEVNVVVVAGDGDTASIGGNHLIHTIRRNANVTVLCNNNEIYGLTGGQTGPTTPIATKTLSSPAGNPNTPINLQAIVRSSPHALYAKTTVYHQLHMRNVIREALEWDGFSFVDITSQCIENNGRRIGFASANEMLTFYRKTYKRAGKDAEWLNPFEIGIVYPRPRDTAAGDGAGRVATNGRTGAAHVVTDGSPTTTDAPPTPSALPEQPAAPLQSATESPGIAGATAPSGSAAAEPPAGVAQPPAGPARTDDEKERKRAAAQAKLAVMAKLSSDVKLRIAQGEVSLDQALADAGVEMPRELRTGASAPAGVAVPLGEVAASATGADPQTERKAGELDAQKGEAVAEARDLVGGVPGGDPQPARPRTPEDAAPPVVAVPRPADAAPPADAPRPGPSQTPQLAPSDDPKERRRAEAQRKLALMNRLTPETKLRVARGEIQLADALREAGIDPGELGT